MNKIICCLLLSLCSQFSISQVNENIDSIAVIAQSAIHDSIVENRSISNNKLKIILESTIAQNESFDADWSKVNQISVVFSPDNKFKIYSWMITVDDNVFVTYGYIQFKDPKLKFIVLKPNIDNFPSQSKVVNSQNWYSSIIYNIKKFKTNKGVKYLLFGFKKLDNYSNLKMVDVMTMNGRNLAFGAPIFEKKIKNKIAKPYRLILEYSSKTTVRMNFDEELDMIVHDHLEPMSINPSVEGLQYIPDGTYEAYTFKKGVFSYIEELPTTAMETAPVPKPVFGKEKKDIMGKKKK